MEEVKVLVDIRYLNGVWFMAGIILGSIMGAVITLLFRGETDC